MEKETSSSSKRKASKKVVEKKAGSSKQKKNRTKNGSKNASARPSKGKAPAPKKLKPKRNHSSDVEGDSEDDASWPCLICGETFSRSREKWVQCQECKLWAHEDCTDGGAYFVCPNCDSDDDI